MLLVITYSAGMDEEHYLIPGGPEVRLQRAIEEYGHLVDDIGDGTIIVREVADVEEAHAAAGIAACRR